MLLLLYGGNHMLKYDKDKSSKKYGFTYAHLIIIILAFVAMSIYSVTKAHGKKSIPPPKTHKTHTQNTHRKPPLTTKAKVQALTAIALTAPIDQTPEKSPITDTTVHPHDKNTPVLTHTEAKNKNTVTSMTSNHQSIPINANMLGIHGSVGAQESHINISQDNFKARARLGVGYDTYQNDKLMNQSYMGGQYALGFAFNDTSAIAAQFTKTGAMKDVVLSGAFFMPSFNTTFKYAGSYLWGKQEFAFISGTKTNNLAQSGLYISAEHNVLEENSRYIHSVGASLWTAQAYQRTVQPVMEYYSLNNKVYNDIQNVALGQLLGSTIDMQVAPLDNIVMKMSLGYEQLAFAKADGSRIVNRTLYHSLAADFEPVEKVLLSSEYRKGSSEARLTVKMQLHNMSVGLYENWGLQGINGTKGAFIAYDLFASLSSTNDSLSKRLRMNSQYGKSVLLENAMMRPSQIPLSFMAIVDNTADQLLATISDSVASDPTIVMNGNNIIIAVPNINASSPPSQITVTKTTPQTGTTTLTNSSVASFSGTSINISLPALHQTVTTAENHTYNISFQDSTGATQTVTLNITSEGI